MKLFTIIIITPLTILSILFVVAFLIVLIYDLFNPFNTMQYRGELNMDITIYDLSEEVIDRFITQDTDRYGRIIRRASEFNKTVDLLINVKAFSVNEEHIFIEFPNGNQLLVPVQSNYYHKIEVL